VKSMSIIIKYKTGHQLVILSLAVILILLAASCSKDSPTAPKKNPVVTGPLALHTEGRWFMNEDNEKVILRGVNIASLEWTNTGENVLQSLNHVITVWGANLARIPLSQDRWFGKASGQTDGGVQYRNIVDALVKKSMESKTYILLELHWNNGNVWGQYIGQHKMPDSLSQVFLQDLATTYANNPAVLIGTYNDPHDVSWTVWLNGGEVKENFEQNGVTTPLDFDTPGQQKLYDAIRATGANNLIVCGGLDWGYDLSGVLNGFAVNGTNIVYDTHPYPWKSTDWDGKWGDVGRQYPLLVGEWGAEETAVNKQYGTTMTNYLRYNKFCWTAWDFHVSAGPTLILDWNYTPTWFGLLVMKELNEPITIDDSL